MSQILYINILVDWSLSGIMTSKLVIRESESPRPATSSVLISRMTSSSVIIQYSSHNLQTIGRKILRKEQNCVIFTLFSTIPITFL